MRFIDGNDDKIYTLQDIRNSWLEFKAEDPKNVRASFLAEMFEIITATVYCQNDLSIVGLTRHETNNIMNKLRKIVL